jgi:hypothetical protein
MAPTFVALGSLILVAVLWAVLRTPVRRWLALRGDRVVTCPDNGSTVAVRLDAAHAALSRTGGADRLRLESCTRWPEKAGCGQECLAQIAGQGTDCLVKTQVTRWYVDKTCVLCGKALGTIDWTQHQPAVRTPDGQTLQWGDIKPETLPLVFATHAAVCWNCHVAETFRRQRPDLVIDNPHAGTSGP